MASRLNFMHSILLVLTALFCTLCSYLNADRVESKDGSVLYGKILGISDGNLSFETSYSSTVNIPLEELVGLFSSNPISIRDENNNTLEIKSVPSSTKLLDVKDFIKTKDLNFQNIQHLWIAESTDPFFIREEQERLALQMRWKSMIGLDLTGSSGDTDSFGVGLRLDSSYSNQIRELDLFLSYNTHKTNGIRDTDEVKGGAEYDFLFLERLAWYLRTDFEHDPIENLDLRSTGASGLKYDWIQEINLQVSSRIGTAIRYENSNLPSIADATDPAFDLGLEYQYAFLNRLSLEGDITILPKMENLSDFLMNHDTAVIFPLSTEKEWYLRSGLIGTYDSIPENDSQKLDIKYYLRLTYEFD